MSGIVKSVGKAFKSVMNSDFMKVALPVLAVGAIAFTGGAALGLFGPAGMSGTIGALGLGPVMTGALTTAAQGATAGALISGVTGGDILKGASTGLLVGAAAGGAGAALGGIGSGVSATSQAASAGGASAAEVGSGLAAGGQGGALAMGAPEALAGVDAGANAAIAGGSTAATGAAAGAAAGAGTAGIGANVGIGSKFLDTLSKPVIVGSLMSGIGGAISSSENAATARQMAAQYRANYSNYGGLNTQTSGTTGATPVQATIYRDPNTGQLIYKGNQA